jgi:hypothetical protein
MRAWTGFSVTATRLADDSVAISFSENGTGDREDAPDRP